MLSLLNTTFTNTLRQGFTLIGSLLSKLRARSTYFENKTGTKVILQEIDSAELLEKASIITTPTAYSDGVLHSVKPSESPYADFTFTRNNAGTRVNASGNIESVGVDLPRIDYTNGSGSLLLEPSRSNKLSTSNDFNGSGWLISYITATANQVVSPDGTLNASKLEMTGNGSLRNISEASFNNGYAYSIFIKKGNSRYVTIRSAFFTQSIVVGFDLDTLTAQTNGKIEDYGNDWYRLSITKDISGDADKSGFFYLYLPNSLGSQTSESGNYAYFYGGQIEDGSYPTSYIPTSGSTVTRGADSATDAGSSNLISSTEGVLYAEIAASSDELDGTYKVITLNNGIVDEYVLLGFTDINNIYASVGGTFISSLTPTNATEFHKVAIKYEDNNSKLFINGVQVGTTNTNATVPSGLNNLDFHTGIGGSPFKGNVKCVAVFKEALTDQELTALTS